jgi:gamma-glutamyltranspeptidase/glutathione hydrolase
MGGFMQPQGHLQLALNLLAFGMDAQTAVDAPRLCIADGTAGGAVSLEEGIAPEAAEALARAGHRVGARSVAGFARALFGRAQVVLRDPRSFHRRRSADSESESQTESGRHRRVVQHKH